MSNYVKRTARIVRSPSHAEVARVLDVTGKHVEGFRDHMIVSLASGAGLRELEIVALNVGDVAAGGDIRGRVTLHVFKGSKRKPLPTRGRDKKKGAGQYVFLSRLLQRKMGKFLGWKKRRGESLAPDAPLFISQRKGRLATRTIRHRWAAWQKLARFTTTYTFHELRHYFGTTLLARTKNPVIVQRALRHASLESTEIYMHPSDDEIRRAVEG